MKPLIDRLPPIFAECVADSIGGRWAIGVPWIYDRYAYATNGSAMVRMPWQGKNTRKPKEGKFPGKPDLMGWEPELYRKRACVLPEEPEKQPQRAGAIGNGPWLRIAERFGEQVWISTRYYELLLAHGAVLYLSKTKKRHAMRFAFGDVEGLMLPRDNDSYARLG